MELIISILLFYLGIGIGIGVALKRIGKWE